MVYFGICRCDDIGLDHCFSAGIISVNHGSVMWMISRFSVADVIHLLSCGCQTAVLQSTSVILKRYFCLFSHLFVLASNTCRMNLSRFFVYFIMTRVFKFQFSQCFLVSEEQEAGKTVSLALGVTGNN